MMPPFSALTRNGNSGIAVVLLHTLDQTYLVLQNVLAFTLVAPDVNLGKSSCPPGGKLALDDTSLCQGSEIARSAAAAMSRHEPSGCVEQRELGRTCALPAACAPAHARQRMRAGRLRLCRSPL